MAHRGHGDQRAPAGRAVRPAWRRDRPDLPAPPGRDRTDGDDLRPAADGRVLVAQGLLTTTDSKMSKSPGNFVTIRDALATASARAIRFAFFSFHYRSPMELTDDTFSRAARALARLDRF